MNHQLHILVHPPEEWVQVLLAESQRRPDLEVEVVDLNALDPDYKQLVERIFSVESVVTW